MIKNEYVALKKKLDLPPFELLDNEFEISSIDSKGFLLREIKKRIDDKISCACELLTKLVQPDATLLADLYEYRCFDEAGKKKIFELFSQVMFLKRRINEADFVLDDKQDAAVIKEAAERWPTLREQMLPFVKALEACWRELPESDHELKEYLG